MSKILCVLDGFGLSPKSANNAPSLAKMPNFKYLLKNYFWSTLNADGVNVGQEGGLVGNSEVGHMNIGGLKLVPQLSFQITKSAENSFDLNKEIAPDQFFDPKKFLEKNWQSISLSELKQKVDENSIQLCQVYDLCVSTDFLDGGEKLNNDPVAVSVANLVEFFETWWIYSDMSLSSLKEMVAKLESEQKELGHNNKNLKTKIEVFTKLKNIYESLQITTSIELITHFNQKRSKNIHLAGLFSTGQIHSDLRHWAGAIEAAGKAGAEKIVLHIISDGRDSDRQSLVATWEYFIKEFESKLKPFENKIFLGSLGGRFYTMDRDNNFDRVTRGILPMFNYKTFDQKDDGDLTLLKKFILSKYNVDLNKILESEKELLEKDNRHFETDEEYKEYGYKNFYVNEEEHSFFLNRDKDERIKRGQLATDITWMLESRTEDCYAKAIYDEFLLPCSWYYIQLNAESRPFEGISKNDSVWLINFRTDRMKQFAQVLTDIDEEFKLNLTILANNSYGIKKEEFLNQDLETSKPHLPGHFGEETYQKGCYYPIFKNQPVEGTLAEYISKTGKTQLHIAETEKYNHVTYFMNGGQNKKWENETWEVIDSNKVNSHAEKPEMKAKEVTDFILQNGLGKYDYILVNYANPDMVGHTGDILAATATMEFLDKQLGRLVQACEDGGHEMVITADHGNVEKVGDYLDGDKTLIDTEHNANYVPLVILSSKFKSQNNNLDKKSVSTFLDNANNLVISKVSSPNLEDLKLLFNQKNQINLSDDQWLNLENIPQPILPLWYSGLLLVCL